MNDGLYSNKTLFTEGYGSDHLGKEISDMFNLFLSFPSAIILKIKYSVLKTLVIYFDLLKRNFVT